MTHGVASPRVCLTIWALLLLFTAITVVVAGIDLGVMNVVVMLAIAVTKALLVILYFMDVRDAPQLTRIVVASGFAWFVLLVAFTMADVLTRG
ncbi:MAG TPA: cytochrome C oxidase subunit IV family protein [Candidatus Limnocylindria bacterium]|nr:cytochrome C oxidase subunit IV family protein [Candidatus Limnocylindria bacterium]